MTLFTSKTLRRKRFFKAFHFVLSFILTLNMSAAGVLLTPSVASAEQPNLKCKLELIKSVDKETAAPGDTVTYTISFKNKGDKDCTGGGVRIDDAIPPSMSYVAGSNQQSSNVSFGYPQDSFGTPNPSGFDGTTLSWNAGTVVPTETGWVSFQVKVDENKCHGNIQNNAHAWVDNHNSAIPSNPVHTKISCEEDDEQNRLSVSKTGTGTGTVTSDPEGINCESGSNCSQSYVEGTVVALTATAAIGSTFAGWSGDTDCLGTGPCVVIMDAAKTVTATFNLIPPVLTPILSATKTANKTTVLPGESFRYTIHIVNSGTDVANGVAVNDLVRSELTIVGTSCAGSNGATCSQLISVSPMISYTGNLPANSFFDVFIDVTVKTGTPAGVINNTVGVVHSSTSYSTTATDLGVTVLSSPVVLNAMPVANAHGPYEGTLSGGTVRIDLIGSGTDTDGTIVKYEWDFDGNGTYDFAIPVTSPSTSGSTFHNYTAAGVYHPVLRVTDNGGATDTDVTTVTVLAHGPAVSFNVTPDSSFVTADQTLPLYATASDALGNSWDATADTAFSENDPCGTVAGSTYNPCKAGNWEITGTYGGFSDTVFVNVTTGTLYHIVVTPNSKPEVIQEGNSRDFNAKGYDADNNEVTLFDLTWSTTGEKVAIGKIDQNGKLTATHGGIGKVTASSGDVSASVGVVVKQVKKTTTVVTLPEPSTGGTGGIVTGGEETTTPPGEETVGEEETTPEEELQSTEEGEVAGATASECTTWPWWVWYLLTAGYIIFLILYYMNLQRLEKDHGLVRNWWAVPLLLTAVLLVIYFLYRCPDVFLRWPWVLILSGVIVSAIYYQSRESSELPPEGPVSQTPGGGQVKSI